MLQDATSFTAILLCTDDTLVVLPESKLPREAKVASRFTCRDRELLPTDFKGVDLIQDDGSMIISQQGYIESKVAADVVPDKPSKTDAQRVHRGACAIQYLPDP